MAYLSKSKIGSLSRSTLFLSLLVRGLGLGLGFGLTLFLVRMLTAEQLGRYYLLIMLVALVSSPVAAGWSQLILRTVAGNGDASLPREIPLIVGSARCLSLLFGIILLALAAAFYGIDLSNSGFVISILFCAIVVISQNNAFRMAIIRGSGHPVAAQTPELIVLPLSTGCLILIYTIVTGDKASAVEGFAIYLAGTFICLLLGAYMLRRLVPRQLDRITLRDLDWSLVKVWGMATLTIGSTTLLRNLGGQAESYILVYLTDTEALAKYRIALQLAALGLFVYMVCNFLAAAQFAKAWKKHDLRKIEKISARYTVLSLSFCLSVLLIVCLLDESVFMALFGPIFDSIKPVLTILLIGGCLNIATGMPLVFLTMAGHERSVLKVTVISLLSSGMVSIALIPPLGLTGAAIANVSAMLITNVTALIFAQRKLGVNFLNWSALLTR